ncbi:EAL domain-containing protein [Deinococcus peraridilitoris]|uniref:Diguanylate cyclase (GGDEF) domain-containing protein n=1 Tax=Deinococcus peraridilitoris (strain DSM 19664 / LMG 22246 / CIP 109416 / KR-200) TaxID=937777 RepID=L0A825_DEIPD|nr:EAL domain-containing protein [Deinococcus peraridilitoris]AFZ69579.1 diguanylate cyclase (GGDEF) domain-containing protein [Deinococcus peraridilitoris DSM 19664]
MSNRLPTPYAGHTILEEALSQCGLDDQRAMLLFEQAASIARDTRDRALLAKALNGMARIEHAHGDSHAALFHLREALELRRETHDLNGEAAILCNLGALYTDLGQYNFALDYLLKALGIIDEQSDRKRASMLAANLARVYDALEQTGSAEEHYQTALRLARESQQRIGEVILCANYGDFRRRQGHYDHAEQLLRHALECAGGEGVFPAIALHPLGLLHRDRHDRASALDAFAQAMRFAREHNDTDTLLEIILSQAETHLQCDTPELARQVLEEGVQLAEESGRNRTLGRILHLLTDALERLDQPSLALAVSRRANQVDSDVLTAEAYRQTRQLTTQYELERAKAELEAQHQKYDAQRLAKEELEREATARLRELERQALYDPLTGLPNRLLLADRFRVALELAVQQGTQLALGVIDLNKFKQINDTFGHHIGDQLLVEVARRLEVVMNGQDTVARMGGDEFVLLIRDADRPQTVLSVARRVLRAFEPVFALSGHELHVRPSVGFAVYPDDALTYEALFEQADKAMYDAKVRGSGFEIHNHQSERRAPATLESALHQALALGQFKLVYQPQTTAGGQVRGAETFLRWQHPHFGNVPPAEFLPLAEATGLSLPIGAWVLAQACQEATTWHGRMVAVNLSARQFAHPNLSRSIHEALECSGLPPHLLELEVNEEMLARHPHRARSTLQDLKALGVRVVIDDFGSGFTSFAALKHDPVDGVKIDRALVNDLQARERPGRDEALVTAVVHMAHALNLDVIAEGVENEYQQCFLASLGVTAVQGFLLAPPQPSEVFRLWMESH